MLCDGRVQLSICSESGKKVLIRNAGSGEPLGLTAALTGKRHEQSCDTLSASRITVIQRKDLMRFLRQHPEAAMQIVQFLSRELHHAYNQVRSVVRARNRRSMDASKN